MRRSTPTIEGRRIAVVTPLPVSGIEGGNERHWRSLTAALVDAGHDAELVARVSPEAGLAEVLDSYAMFHDLDLSDYDVVISGKYPSFMVRHDCHIRHLNHPLRGLYEHYPAHLTTDLPNDLTRPLDDCADHVDELIGWAREIAEQREGDPVVAFPGPLARAVVQRLDSIARDRLTAEAAVSETVANRPDYVDPNRAISIIPPLGDLTISDDTPIRTAATCPTGPFLFTFGRLDRAKRFDLILRAFAAARRLPGMGSTELIVAGEGPLTDELTASAGKGVRFVGRLSDADLQAHLASARAVVLSPVDEDYGLVAAEAMAAGTAVITTSDSGGIAEQVVDGRNGLIVHPRVPLLARAMRSLMTDGARAERMGRAARDVVRPLSWDPMLELIDHVTDPTPTPSVLLLSTFPADPVQSGGQRRLRGMAAGLAANGWQPTVLSLTNRLGPAGLRRRRTSDGVTHVTVGRSHAHLAADFTMATLLGSPIDDVAATELWPATPAFGPELRAQLTTADAVILSHPFLASALPDDGLPPVVYDAFNVETDLKATLFAGRDGGDWVASRSAESEAEAIGRASLVCATSTDDLGRFAALGLLDRETRTVVAVNPLAADVVRARTDAEQTAARQRFLLDTGTPDDQRPIVVFLGSDHPPNRRAAARCLELATARPDLHVVIGGSVNVAAVEGAAETNATLVGPFAESDLRRLQTMADAILNPVEDGSGTSLKLIDPLSLGVPVVATHVGARGIDDPEQCIWLSDLGAPALGSVIDDVLTDTRAVERRRRAGITVALGAQPEQAMRGLADELRALVSHPTNS